MTQQQRTTRRERHIAVDVLAITGGGLIVDALSRGNALSFIGALAVIGAALWLDRRNALDEDKEDSQ
jgi:hypothetical protein